jgi:hypothetical protein
VLLRSPKFTDSLKEHSRHENARATVSDDQHPRPRRARRAAGLRRREAFQDDDASREKDEPTTWLKDYDKLVEGKEADWVFFDGYSAGSYKSVAVKEFSATEKDKEARHAAEYGKEYAEQWIQESKKLGWEVVSGGKADLTIEGNVATPGSRAAQPASGGAGTRTPAPFRS